MPEGASQGKKNGEWWYTIDALQVAIEYSKNNEKNTDNNPFHIFDL